jgi:antitoxin (DNA-binding transcriptional repressor) of toxin-antitoxin stability system
MTTVSIKEAQDRFPVLARLVEEGETVVVTRKGEPVLDLVPHRKGGLDLEAGAQYLRERGIINPFPYVAEDFDDPLPDDILIRPLPDR